MEDIFFTVRLFLDTFGLPLCIVTIILWFSLRALPRQVTLKKVFPYIVFCKKIKPFCLIEPLIILFILGIYTTYYKYINANLSQKYKILEYDKIIAQQLYTGIYHCNHSDFNKCKEDVGKRKKCFNDIDEIQNLIAICTTRSMINEKNEIVEQTAINIMKCKIEHTKKVDPKQTHDFILPKPSVEICTKHSQKK